MYPNLSTTPSNDHQFGLDKINEIKDYFIAEIKERKLMSKNLVSIKELVSILLLLTILINH